MKTFFILLALFVILLITNCSEQKDAPPILDKSEQVSDNLIREDRWEGNVHYVVFYRTSGYDMFVVNYTADSASEAMNRQYGGSFSIDTTVQMFERSTSVKGIVSGEMDTTYFKPILNHSEIPGK